MKKTILFIFLFIGLLSFGQDAELEEKPSSVKESKIRLNPFFSYDFNLSNETVNNEYGGTDFYYEKVNYRFGVDVDYFIKKNISISTGVNFSNKDYESIYFCESCFSPLLSNIKLKYLEFPLYGTYHLSFNKFNVFGQLGIVNHITLKREVHFDDQEIILENINKYYLSGKIGIGISYPVFGKHRLFVSSDYITGFTNVFDNYNYKLKSIGIRMGVQFLL
jgi:hypothetical protein